MDSGTEGIDSGTERVDSGTERVGLATEEVDSGTEWVNSGDLVIAAANDNAHLEYLQAETSVGSVAQWCRDVLAARELKFNCKLDPNTSCPDFAIIGSRRLRD